MADPPRDPRIPDLVSLKEASEILGVSRQFAHRLVIDGDLRGARIGKAWVFRRAAVLAYRAKQGNHPDSIPSAAIDTPTVRTASPSMK